MHHPPGTRTGQFLSLARTYWGDPASRLAWVLLVFLLVGEVASSWIIAWYTEVQKAFFDTMTARDAAGFRAAVMMTFVVAAVSATVGVTGYFVQRVVQINWRQHMTGQFVGRWMRGHVPYRIERDHSVDNADQRISEDIRLFCDSALMLGLSLLGTLANLVIFGRLLWQNSGAITLTFGSTRDADDPGVSPLRGDRLEPRADRDHAPRGPQDRRHHRGATEGGSRLPLLARPLARECRADRAVPGRRGRRAAASASCSCRSARTGSSCWCRT